GIRHRNVTGVQSCALPILVFSSSEDGSVDGCLSFCPSKFSVLVPSFVLLEVSGFFSSDFSVGASLLDTSVSFVVSVVVSVDVSFVESFILLLSVVVSLLSVALSCSVFSLFVLSSSKCEVSLFSSCFVSDVSAFSLVCLFKTSFVDSFSFVDSLVLLYSSC